MTRKYDHTVIEIPLSKGKVALIDACDAELIGKYKWYLQDFNKKGRYYARCNLPGRKSLGMHRLIMAPPDGMVVDHINGYGLDNRRANLRVATRSQNMCNSRIMSNNTSGMKGVSFYKSRGCWRAQIGFQRKITFLGYFDTQEAAYAAHQQAAANIHGEFSSYTGDL